MTSTRRKIGRPPSDQIAEGERSRQILHAAADLFNQRGYAAVSLGEIAAAVGVTKAALYHHYPSKDDLYTAVMCDLLVRIAAGIRRIDRLDLPLAEKFRLLITTAHANMRLSTSMETMMRDVREQLTPAQQERIGAAHREMDAALAAIMDAGIAADELRHHDPALLAHAFRQLLAGLRNDQGESLAQEQVAALIDLFLHGILSSAAGHHPTDTS